MSKADEMFKELGYKQEKEAKNAYYNVITPVRARKFKHETDIEFIDGDIIISETAYDRKGDLEVDTIYLNAKIVQVMYLKCKELGWLDE